MLRQGAVIVALQDVADQSGAMRRFNRHRCGIEIIGSFRIGTINPGVEIIRLLFCARGSVFEREPSG